MGSNLITDEAIKSRDWAAINRKIYDAVNTVKEIR
jgi:hypothetical protein